VPGDRIYWLVFFIAAVWMNRNEDDCVFHSWLFAGFIIDVLWSGLQGATFYCIFSEAAGHTGSAPFHCVN